MKTNNLFYIRQLGHLLRKGTPPEESISLMSQGSTGAPRHWNELAQHYRQTQNWAESIAKLQDNELKELEGKLRLADSINIEQEDVLKRFAFESNNAIEMISIAKSKILNILTYSAFISLIALIVMVIFNLYVWPVFFSTLIEGVEQSQAFADRIDAVSFKSMTSFFIYSPPLLLIGLFAYFYFTPAEKLLRDNWINNRLPIINGIRKQIARVNFLKNLASYHHALHTHDTNSILNSSFFNSFNKFNFSNLFNTKEKEYIQELARLGTYKDESGLLITTIETEAIEKIHNTTSFFSTIMHILLILVVANIIFALYIPIFKLGGGI